MSAESSLVAQTPENRAGWLSRALHGFGADLRFSLRTLAKSRSFAISALVTLALCVGATTAIFSTVYTLMLKLLPFDQARAWSGQALWFGVLAGYCPKPQSLPRA